MEGLAGEAFETISMQRGLDACYASISNLAWYGVQPLEIGLDDITRPVEAEDGIWFGPYREGVPGVQPNGSAPTPPHSTPVTIPGFRCTARGRCSRA